MLRAIRLICGLAVGLMVVVYGAGYAVGAIAPVWPCSGRFAVARCG